MHEPPAPVRLLDFTAPSNSCALQLYSDLGILYMHSYIYCVTGFAVC